IAPVSCYSGAPGTAGVGACRAGSQTCTSGSWSACSGEVVPRTEACDGADDDCNGAVDDVAPSACGAGTLCSAGRCTSTLGCAPDASLFGGFGGLACGGAAIALTNLAGTAGCTPLGTSPEGWRLAINASTWDGSHNTGLGCMPHLAHSCGYPGGLVAPAQGYP